MEGETRAGWERPDVERAAKTFEGGGKEVEGIIVAESPLKG